MFIEKQFGLQHFEAIPAIHSFFDELYLINIALDKTIIILKINSILDSSNIILKSRDVAIQCRDFQFRGLLYPYIRFNAFIRKHDSIKQKIEIYYYYIGEIEEVL